MLGELIKAFATVIILVTHNNESFQDQPSLSLASGSGLQQGSRSQNQCLCPMVYDPLCGNDGKTYGSKCQLDCAKLNNKDLNEAHQGECERKGAGGAGAGSLNNTTSLSVQELIELANLLEAPFSQASLDRLHLPEWPTSRAARTSNAILFNRSKKEFNLASTNCAHGILTPTLNPEKRIKRNKSSTYGMESHGFLTGLECNVKYLSADGSYFEVHVSNPFVGSNGIDQWHSPTLKLTPANGSGNHNQVRWIIEDN